MKGMYFENSKFNQKEHLGNLTYERKKKTKNSFKNVKSTLINS